MVKIRKADVEEADCLTKISFASKRYWSYPESYFEIWEPELTITIKYIEENEVWVYEKRDRVIAYYSLVTFTKDINTAVGILCQGAWLEHMFVHPDCIGNSVGSQLYAHMCQFYGAMNIKEIWVLADPNARGFYEKMGCRYIKEYPSTIPGRTTPLLKQVLPIGRIE